MFLNAVILVLQEILEAALLISVLMVLRRLFGRMWPAEFMNKKSWVNIAIFLGLAGAALYAWQMPAISEWFEYAGYEITNALMQFIAVVLLITLCIVMHPGWFLGRAELRYRVVLSCMIGMVIMGVVREGSEIILYIHGIFGQPENITPVFLGLLMAAGIGVSCSVMLFSGLLLLSDLWAFRSAMLLLAFFAGNMSSQCVLLFIQADWIQFSTQAWDSSFLVNEGSILGHLLYALVGYEANPAWAQVAAYLFSAAIILLSPLSRLAWLNAPDKAQQS